MTVNVREQLVCLPDGRSWTFPLEDEAKSMLIEGLDAIDITLKMSEQIAAFQSLDRLERPWIYLGDAK